MSYRAPREALDISVVVPSHNREASLRVLLAALAAQTLPRDRWEVVVAHTYDAGRARLLFADHELSRNGTLRAVPVDAGSARASRQRNIGWQAAGGRFVAFTDDDCRPEPDWLERLLAAAETEPGAIVQGLTRPDPRDGHLVGHAHIRTVVANPPDYFTQTCNIAYERELLERIGGFDEDSLVGEDVDLSLRAFRAGATLVAAPDAITNHAVEALSITEKMRSQFKWQHLAYLVKRHPELRDYCEWGVWYKREHTRAFLALVSLLGGRRHPWMLAGVVPYIRLERWRHGPAKRQQLRAIREVPAHWLIDIVEIGTFLVGSLRYRTFLL